ncbi:MAG: thioredoxin family protein [bacterium]
MKFKLFWKEGCPACPVAKNIIHQLAHDGYLTIEHDLETTEGLAEAAFYGILSTPTIMLIDNQDSTVAEWRGKIPTLEEARQAAGPVVPRPARP